MKRKLLLLMVSLLSVTVIGVMIIALNNKEEDSNIQTGQDRIKVVTTIYPITMIGLNIADQVEEIEIKSLTEMNTGCLHDYQLTSEDMKMISNADLLIINGGGMETFLDDILANYPDLKIIDASEGISMLPHEAWEQMEHGHEDEEEDAEYNSHVWLDPELYMQQIKNVRDGLIEFIKNKNTQNSNIVQVVEANSEAYLQKVESLSSKIDDNFMTNVDVMNGNTKDQVVIFHDAFAYLAKRVGLEIAYTIPLDDDTALSAGQIAEIVDVVRNDNIRYLFTEKQYDDTIANRIESETDAEVYIIDSVVTGDGSKDSYIEAMQENLSTIQEAFYRIP